jgi:hypothetical protein
VIREAMRSKALVALGRIVLSKRERVMALEPYEKGLVGRKGQSGNPKGRPKKNRNAGACYERPLVPRASA